MLIRGPRTRKETRRLRHIHILQKGWFPFGTVVLVDRQSAYAFNRVTVGHGAKVETVVHHVPLHAQFVGQPHAARTEHAEAVGFVEQISLHLTGTARIRLTAAFSDGKTLYATETETGRLWAWPILGPGKLGIRRSPARTAAITAALLFISASMMGHMFARVGAATLDVKWWLYFMMSGGLAIAFVVPSLWISYSQQRISTRLALIDGGFWLAAWSLEYMG